MRLGKSDFFGERALLKNEPRAVSVVAIGYVDCLVLERADFVNLLGPLEPILAREAQRRGEVRGGALKGRMGGGMAWIHGRNRDTFLYI